MKKKAYTIPVMQVYSIEHNACLLAGSIIGDSISGDIATGNDPDLNLAPELDLPGMPNLFGNDLPGMPF